MAEQTRPPIVTILGHVDHGKTTLLDFIRKSSVASREHGGITQAIGAYQVIHEGNLITFIDTPGHAAFEKMRSRGAKVADIAVLVVAADDGIMPQTVEAIKHIQEAKVSMIVAINKIDIPGIDVKVSTEKIKRQLSDQKVLIEEYGGDVPIVPLSAKSGDGVDKLLEIISLVAEVNEIKGDPDLPPAAVVIEANMDKFKGPVATFLVRNGSLKKGQTLMAGGVIGKVKGMFDYAGKALDIAGPSTPVEVIGLEEVPPVGAVIGEEGVKSIKDQAATLIERMRAEDKAVLNVIVKADTQGSLEAVVEGLKNLNNEDGEHVKVVSSGTGDILESDIKMASTVRGIVLGFNVKVVHSAVRLAEVDGVLVRTYTIIYELLEEMEEVVEDMLKVGAIEEVFGTAQILQVFDFGKTGKIAGARILDGNISKGQRIRVVRGEEVVSEVKIKSLKKLKNEVAKVEKGDECGFMFEPQIDFQVGDLVQSFRTL